MLYGNFVISQIYPESFAPKFKSNLSSDISTKIHVRNRPHFKKPDDENEMTVGSTKVSVL